MKLKPVQPCQVLDVAEVPCDEVVHADDMVSLRDEAVTKVGAKESGCTGNEDALHGFQLEGRRPIDT
jgi:hypothetical protein